MSADKGDSRGKGTIVVDDDRCTGCGLCIPECPVHVIGMSPRINAQGFHPVELVAPGCLPCNRCAVVCPDVAITVYRLDEDEIEEEYARLGD